MIDNTFRRVRTLQPNVTEEFFNDDAESVNNRQLVNDLRIAISCWDPPVESFGSFFRDEFTVQKVVRQIVTGAVVKTQRVRCRIVHSSVAYDGGKLHDSPLPSSLRSLSESYFDLNFPTQPVYQRKRIFAGESLSVCTNCEGAAEVACDTCDGAGVVSCRGCETRGERACRVCNGAGEVMATATESVQCQSCAGNGTYQCRACYGDGTVACSDCTRGMIPCKICDASGMMREQTFLHKETFIDVKHLLHCKNGWVDPGSELATDLVVMKSQAFKGNGAHISAKMLRDVLTENFRKDAATFSRSMAKEETKTDWDLGTKFELRYGYIYHVVVEHMKQQSELFVSGCSNSVTLFKAAEQPRGLGKLKRGLMGFVEPPGSGGQSTNHEHIEAFRAGEAFLADINLIGPGMRKYGVGVSLTPDGYEVTIPNAPVGHNKVLVNFNYDAAGNIVLHSTITLGEADRDCFSEALSLCSNLPVGQIAMQAFNGGALERFSLVDRQVYATSSAPHLAYLLRRMASTAYQIRKSKRIGLSL
jgi:hypothetical protein